MSSATAEGDTVRLDAKKSWITSAQAATDYVWSSKPTAGSEASTIWLVPSRAKGLKVPQPFNGLGLRGNDSTPVTAEGVEIPLGNRLGEDGEGFGIMMGTVLPNFSLMIAAGSLGLGRTTGAAATPGPAVVLGPASPAPVGATALRVRRGGM